MEKAVVIVAGGKGSRMQMDVPKQFISINNKPIIVYTIEAFLSANDAMQVIVICHTQYISELTHILNQHFGNMPIQIVEGGATRFHSSYAGLKAVTFKNGLVAIHDAARPFIKPTVIKQCFESCAQKGNAIPAIPVTDSIRSVENEPSAIVDRSVLRKIQTPQCFQLNQILAAYKVAVQKIETESIQFTDDASVLEWYGKPIFLCEGQIDNFKITTPFDLKLAELIL